METLFDTEEETETAQAGVPDPYVPLTDDSRRRLYRRLPLSARKVLGEPTRALDVLRALVCLGVSPGTWISVPNRVIGDLVGVSPATVTHHIDSLQAAGLIGRAFGRSKLKARSLKLYYPHPARFTQDY